MKILSLINLVIIVKKLIYFKGVANLYNIAPGISFGSQSGQVYMSLYWNLMQGASDKVVYCIN